MINYTLKSILCAVFCSCLISAHPTTTGLAEESAAPKTIHLPAPRTKGKVSVEEAIYSRRSIRKFQDVPLKLDDVAQILWAAGGKTIDGLTGATRSFPSAGGIYPLEIYLVAGKVEGLPTGIYRYRFSDHSLVLLKTGDHRGNLAKAAWGQNCVASAPVDIVITAQTGRTGSRYGPRGENRYVPMDTGHSGQNVHLQAQALGLGAVMIGAFDDAKVTAVLGVKGERPLYIVPVGYIMPVGYIVPVGRP